MNPKKRKRLKWVVGVLVFILFVVYGLPYVAAAGLLAYLKFRDPFDSWASLESVPIEHTLVPEPDVDSGQSFSFEGLMFASPLTDLILKNQSMEDGGGNARYISGDKTIGVLYFTSDAISTMIPSMSKMLTSSYGQKVDNEYELEQRIFAITPTALFSTPAKTLANGILLYFKALGGSSKLETRLISHTPYVDTIEEADSTTSQEVADIQIFAKDGSKNYGLLVRGLTQGEIDALIDSVRLK